MKTLILAAAAAAATLVAGAAAAQPYGYSRGYDRPAYGDNHDRGYSQGYRVADRDRDGIPDRYDRYDNRRDRAWARHHRHDWRYDRHHRW